MNQTTIKHTCEGTLRSERWQRARCGRTATYQENGKWYCKTHAPAVKAAKSQERMRQWREQADKKRADQLAAARQAAEDARKLTAFPLLVAAVEAALPALGRVGNYAEARDKLRNALKLAKGDPPCTCTLGWLRPKHNDERGYWCDHCDGPLTEARYLEAKAYRESLA